MRVNKTFQFQDMAGVEGTGVPAKLRQLVDQMTRQRLMTTSHALAAKSNLTDVSGWYRWTIYYGRMWEYARVIHLLDFQPGERVLDCGGASSPIVFYLAAMGCQVETIDLSGTMIDNTLAVAKETKWPLSGRVGDMTALPYEDGKFDKVITISVVEHLKTENKVKALREMARVVKPGGLIGITFDFGEKQARLSPDASGEVHAPLTTKGQVEELMIEPSHCRVWGEPLVVADPLEYPAYPRPRLRATVGRVLGHRLNAIIPQSGLFRAICCDPLDRTLGMVVLQKPI